VRPGQRQNPNRIYFRVSDDGGKTFGRAHVVAKKVSGLDYPRQVDCLITVDPSTGAVFVSFLAYGRPDSGTDVAVARSTDFGAFLRREGERPGVPELRPPVDDRVRLGRLPGRRQLIACSSHAGTPPECPTARSTLRARGPQRVNRRPGIRPSEEPPDPWIESKEVP
jgi:hypothetical protein